MRATAFAATILPGKVEAWRELWDEIQSVRREEHEESRRELGITKEAIRLQHTSQGEMAVMYLEAEEPEKIFERLATSDSPFDRWFREWILEIHGVDLTHPLKIPEDVFLWEA